MQLTINDLLVLIAHQGQLVTALANALMQGNKDASLPALAEANARLTSLTASLQAAVSRGQQQAEVPAAALPADQQAPASNGAAQTA